MEGWICPRCGKVHAPWVAECDCKPRWEITCSSMSVSTYDPKKDETKVYFGDIPEEMKL